MLSLCLCVGSQVLLKSLGFGKEEEEEPVNIPSWEWNVFFDNTIR